MRSLISAIMNKFKFYFFLFCSVIILFSCNKSDDTTSIPIRDFDEQYQTDMDLIEDYLNTHYLKENGEISKITEDENFPKIMDLLSEPDGAYPQLRKKPVVIDETTYYIYYLKLAADNTNVEALNPSRVDEVLAAYKGSYLKYVTTNEPVLDKNDNPVLDNLGNPVTQDVTELIVTEFEEVPFPSGFQFLDRVIRGWAEIFPLFKPGNRNPDVVGEPISYSDFGAGIVFIPSGLAYFNQARNSPLSGITIPSYSPLVFNFKLYEVRQADQDGDGILSNDEDINGDGLFDADNDDTDGDGIIDMYDVDDDGDGYNTKNEIRKPTIDGIFIFSGLSEFYPYNPVEDNPFTAVDETEIYGVPRKFTGPPLLPSDPLYSSHSVSTPLPSDYTDPSRLRRYLDKTCFPPYK